MPQPNTVERTRIEIKTDLTQPTEYSVIYVNDEMTTVDFVISSLMEVFSYSITDAVDMTQTIHDQGHAMVAVLPYELAEQKTLEVLTLAKLSGYPLVVKVEPVI